MREFQLTKMQSAALRACAEHEHGWMIVPSKMARTARRRLALTLAEQGLIAEVTEKLRLVRDAGRSAMPYGITEAGRRYVAWLRHRPQIAPNRVDGSDEFETVWNDAPASAQSQAGDVTAALNIVDDQFASRATSASADPERADVLAQDRARDFASDLVPSAGVKPATDLANDLGSQIVRGQDETPAKLEECAGSCAAVNVELAMPIESTALDASAPDSPSIARKRSTRTRQIVEMLRGAQGASLNELMAATGWLPHTTRAALTGLRKRGFVLERTHLEDRGTIYRIAGTCRADEVA